MVCYKSEKTTQDLFTTLHSPIFSLRILWMKKSWKHGCWKNLFVWFGCLHFIAWQLQRLWNMRQSVLNAKPFQLLDSGTSFQITQYCPLRMWEYSTTGHFIIRTPCDQNTSSVTCSSDQMTWLYRGIMIRTPCTIRTRCGHMYIVQAKWLNNIQYENTL